MHSTVVLSFEFVHIEHNMHTVRELQKFGHTVYVVGSFKALFTYLEQILATIFYRS